MLYISIALLLFGCRFSGKEGCDNLVAYSDLHAHFKEVDLFLDNFDKYMIKRTGRSNRNEAYRAYAALTLSSFDHDSFGYEEELELKEFREEFRLRNEHI